MRFALFRFQISSSTLRTREKMPLNYTFAGKRILITGGTRGIGRALVQFFHDDGAQVYTVALNPEGVLKLQQELPKVVAKVANLSNWEETRKVVESFGPVDYLVNNAATWNPESFLEITEGAAQSQFNVNLAAIINISQVVAKSMIENGTAGSIINMGGVSARKYIPGGAVASATKAALESLTRTMAVELGLHNIRVNCVVPGACNGGKADPALLTPEALQYFENTISKLIVKRLIEKKEIADLVAFLLSPMATMIVGECYVIDGGFLIA